MLFARALFAFLALPTVVGGIVPWWILRSDRWRMGGSILGWPVLIVGAAIVVWCVRDFYVIGKGTLAPWDPPKRLVVVGLYRWARNPMYVGVLGFVAGLSLLEGSPLLGTYCLLLAIAFHLRVLIYEEPKLESLFGEDWKRYRVKVGRWLPRLP